MSVIIYIETASNKLRKVSYELAYYGVESAKILGTDCVGVVVGECSDIDALTSCGLTKVIKLDENTSGDSVTIADAIASVAEQEGANLVVFGHSSTGKTLMPRVSYKLNAGGVTGVNSLPSIDSGSFQVSKGVFSSKAFATYEVLADVKVITIMGNSLKPVLMDVSTMAIKDSSVSIADGSVSIIETKKEEGTVPLPEAELVVAAGRGMKGPENWGIIDELAEVLGATTACSRPVADIGWRPHHEHVGQTGVAIRPNLYIAAGISGAIQHLAGVNNSKTIVVINKDPEAPFFKAADYGICADLFDVVPKLTEAIKKFNAG